MKGPSAFLHTGSVACSGLLVDTDLVGEPVARERIVARWSPAAVVTRCALGLLVRWPHPVRFDARTAPGLALVSIEVPARRLLCSAPLPAHELEAIDAGDDDVVVVREGALHLIRRAEAQAVDVAEWLDVPAISLVPVESLGSIARPVLLATASAEAVFAPVVGTAPADIRAMRQAIMGQSEAVGSSWLSRVSAVARKLAVGLTRAARGREIVVRDAERGASWSERVAAVLRDVWARALLRARLARYFAEKQAEYLSETLEMLDRGDFAGALRRAIPLGQGGGDRPVPPALGVPRPRATLAISPTTRRASSTLLLDIHETLRRAYRSAFDRLVAGGRIDEAAFVLAELLRADEEAVSFLEKHGRFKLAAEIAEARSLPPDLVIRQWFLAGDRTRAVRLAKLHGAFGGAIERLERSGRATEATALRLLWADALAERGDYTGAVEVAWSTEDAVPTIRRWIELGMAQGGESSATMVGRLVVLERELTDATRSRVREVLEDTADEGPARRAALARALTMVEATEALRACARVTARALLADPPQPTTPALLRSLMGLAKNSALRADEPTLGRWVPPPVVTKPRVERGRRGLSTVYDAALGPRGRVLLALGETGVRALDRDGRAVATFHEPAHALTVSDSLDRVIVLGARGEAKRLARLDLTRRLSQRWCDARIGFASNTFDGWTWLVTDDDGALVLLDATHDGVQGVRRLSEVGRIVTLARDASSCAFVTSLTLPASFELWRFDLPSWTLRTRTPLFEGRRHSISVRPNGDCLALAGGELQVVTGGRPESVRRSSVVDGTHALAGDGYVAVARRVEEGVLVSVRGWHGTAWADALLLHGATQVGLRAAGATFLAFDDLGRVVQVDGRSGSTLGVWSS